MKLPCDNLHDFINGNKRFYAVDSNNYRVGDRVTLYNDHQTHEFIVTYIYHFDPIVLTLEGVDKID